MRAFRHRDFRLLWSGAFLSFVGSFIQTVAQGWLVYQLTHDQAKLALVTFCSMAPVSIFGPFGGTLADAFHKKLVLNVAQALFGFGALLLAVLTWTGLVQYWHILGVALLFGLVGCFEVPARQSVVGRVVPHEDLAYAVPLNAMTFNSARIIGPAIGGILLVAFGPAICYALNGISYLALIFAVQAIRSDLSATTRTAQPVGDLLMEGMLYTRRDLRLRTLFVMEAITSGAGLFYVSLMPALAHEILGLEQSGYAMALTMIGIGAIAALLVTTYLADRPIKGEIVRYSMFTMGIALVLLAFTRSSVVAFPLFAIIGGAVVMQFSTTNTLFQLLSPERLRGRVIAMHQWAISGLGPFGTLFFGWFAETTKTPHVVRGLGTTMKLPVGGLPLALKVGGACIIAGAIWGTAKVRKLTRAEWEQ
jgi:MFS family permease